MIKISEYLTLDAAVKSATAIRHGIRNVPGPLQRKAIEETARMIYDPLREHFGLDIPITSFFRSLALNQRVGGSATSQHLKGEAMDLDCDGLIAGPSNLEIGLWIARFLPFDELINEFPDANGNPAWIHVSYSTARQRGRILVARKKGGKTVYQATDLSTFYTKKP